MKTNTIVAHCRTDKRCRNHFLVDLLMRVTRTLHCINQEWYEATQQGIGLVNGISMTGKEPNDNFSFSRYLEGSVYVGNCTRTFKWMDYNRLEAYLQLPTKGMMEGLRIIILFRHDDNVIDEAFAKQLIAMLEESARTLMKKLKLEGHRVFLHR